MKSIKERIDEVRSELDSIILEREEFFSQNTIDGIINLTYVGLVRMKELENKMKELQLTLQELYVKFSEEQRNIEGYTVFCITNSEDKINLVSKIIPYTHKELFMGAFDIMNSTELPKLEDVEEWLQNNNQ